MADRCCQIQKLKEDKTMPNKKTFARSALVVILAIALLTVGGQTAFAANEVSYITNTIATDNTGGRSWAIDKNGTLWGVGNNGDAYFS
jgi:hypothetical protein